MVDTTAQEPVTLELLAQEVGALRDLFQRRLLNDRVQKQQHDELCRQLDAANAQLSDQAVAPILRELILLADRVERHADSGEADGFARSVGTELAELLARQGVRRLDTTGASFDPRVHAAAGVRQVESPTLAGVVVAELRAGYVLPHRVLRPADVVVGQYESEREPTSTVYGDEG